MMDPFLIPISEVKAFEVQKPELKPTLIESHQPPVEAAPLPERHYGVKIAALAEGKRSNLVINYGRRGRKTSGR